MNLNKQQSSRLLRNEDQLNLFLLSFQCSNFSKNSKEFRLVNVNMSAAKTIFCLLRNIVFVADLFTFTRVKFLEYVLKNLNLTGDIGKN